LIKSQLLYQLSYGEIQWRAKLKKLIRIIEAIENKYNFTFDREFLGRAVFGNLHMWCFNNLEVSRNIEQLKIDFTSKDSDTKVYKANIGEPQTLITTVTGVGFDELDLTTDILTYSNFYINELFDPPAWYIAGQGRITYVLNSINLEITTASTNSYNIFVYKNGQLFLTRLDLVGTRNVTILYDYSLRLPADEYTFFITSLLGLTFTSTLTKSSTLNANRIMGGFDKYSESQRVQGFSIAQTIIPIFISKTRGWSIYQQCYQ
jgi:hypothetical protein